MNMEWVMDFFIRLLKHIILRNVALEFYFFPWGVLKRACKSALAKNLKKKMDGGSLGVVEIFFGISAGNTGPRALLPLSPNIFINRGVKQ